VGIPFPIEQAGPELMYSPLGDVLLRDTEVADQVLPNSSRFGRLLALAPFEGFLGVPLPAVDAWRYGLILLKARGTFGDGDRQVASLIASLIATGLQERRLLGALQPWQAQNLAGQLMSMVVHEINNKLGGMRYQIDTVQKALQELGRYPEKAGDATFLSRAERAIQSIAVAQEESERLRDQYLGLAASDETQSVDINALVVEMAHLLRTEAQSQNVLLACETPKQRLVVQGRPSQLRQVLLNLMLNAIQQMGRIRREGLLTVTVEHRPQESLPVQIRISDHGPGIHAQLWGLIFDFGFTTRKGGAGLGLTIARAIAAELRGHLHVEESHILVGTTFLLELPGEARND